MIANIIKVSISGKPNLIKLFDGYIRKEIEDEKHHNNSRTYASGSILSYLSEKLDELYGEDNWDENDAYEYARLLGIDKGELLDCINFDDSQYYEDDYYSDEYCGSYWNNNFGVRRKKSKHNKSKKKKKSNKDYYDDYSFDDVSFSNDYCNDEYKEIYFYRDYHEEYDKMEFNSLKEFSDYCEEEGIYVPPYMSKLLESQQVSYCCLNGTSKEHGQLELTVDDSYGNMFYTACTLSEARELEN